MYASHSGDPKEGMSLLTTMAAGRVGEEGARRGGACGERVDPCTDGIVAATRRRRRRAEPRAGQALWASVARYSRVWKSGLAGAGIARTSLAFANLPLTW